MMEESIWRRRAMPAWAAIWSAILGSVALAACGNGGSSGGAAVDSSAILRYGVDLAAAASNFDNIESHGWPATRPANENIFDTIIHESANGGEEPGLATAWSAPDDSTVVLTMRQGVKFQDGTPMDMDAVKFSFDRTIAAEPRNGGKATNFPPQVQAIKSDEVQPGNKIVLHLSAPVAGALIHTWLKESDHIAIVSPTQVQKLGPGAGFDAHPVGAGPYQFVNFQPDQLLQLRSWSGYWDAGERKLGGIDFVETKPGAPAVAALLAGSIEQTDLGPADAASVEGRPEVGISSQPTDGMLMMPVCETKAPFNTLAARQALEYAINRADIGKAASGKYAAVTDSPLATSNPFYVKPGPDVAYTFNQAKAKQLLASAGVPAGTAVSLFVPSPASGIGPASEVVQQELGAVGLNVSIVTGSSDFITNIGRLKPNLAILNNKLSALQNWTMPGGPAAAWCQYSNPDLITAAAGADSASTATASAAWKTEQQIYRSDIPIVFMGSQPGLSGHSPKVHGVTAIHSQGAGPLFRTIYMTK